MEREGGASSDLEPAGPVHHTQTISRARPERSTSRPARTPSRARLPLAEFIRADNRTPISLGGTSSAIDLWCARAHDYAHLPRPAPNKCTPSHVQCCTSPALAPDPQPLILTTPACTSCTTQRRHAVGA
ncbi:hypothetical protein B0H13DRAFT_2312231 [Mycena leptocephala]|nr:hypothetical protein B0H13DRAFT_2312231 [Mycena leptocephala]